jgi:hypothetical protein
MFIRALWGILEHQDRRFYKRREKITNDVLLQEQWKYQLECTVFTWGTFNHRWLKDRGWHSILVSGDPIQWDMDTQQFRHKLEAFRLGCKQFDKCVFLDWDTYLIKPLPADHWKILEEKSCLQATLRMYHRRKAYWRKDSQRQIPCASYVYCSGSAGEDLCHLWEKMNSPWSEELVMAKYIDDMHGGWGGYEVYKPNHEPRFFDLDVSVCSDADLKCFEHYNAKQVSGFLQS